MPTTMTLRMLFYAGHGSAFIDSLSPLHLC